MLSTKKEHSNKDSSNKRLVGLTLLQWIAIGIFFKYQHKQSRESLGDFSQTISFLWSLNTSAFITFTIGLLDCLKFIKIYKKSIDTTFCYLWWGLLFSNFLLQDLGVAQKKLNNKLINPHII